MKSRKALCAALIEMNRLPADTDYRKLDNETYGRDSRIYLWKVAKSQKDRREVERELRRRGFLVREDYHPGSAYIEVSVSYFKGWHHDE